MRNMQASEASPVEKKIAACFSHVKHLYIDVLILIELPMSTCRASLIVRLGKRP